MDKTEIKKRIDKLKKEINHHRYLYHVLDKQEISDGALDSLKNELFKLEMEYPDFITADSPTQRVSGAPLAKFTKHKHKERMISLFDAFSEKDMKDWEERILKIKNKNLKNISLNYFCDVKLDGLAASLIYEKGLLIIGATRGDGETGEKVTENIRTIESAPLRLREPRIAELKEIGLDDEQIKLWQNIFVNGEVEARGEVIMSKKTFIDLNEKYKKENRPLLSNTRNGAAGSIRQLDSRLTAERKLEFYCYEIILPSGILDKQEQKIKLAKLLGFKIVKESKYCANLSAVNKFYQEIESKREKLPFIIDGIVVKVNELGLWSELGIVGKGPRYMMAYKFPAEQATTKVKAINWQIGRTGILTPVALLDPVKAGGVVITHSTLHNMDEIERLDLKIGDTVIVERAGDVIPKVIKVLVNLRTGQEKKINPPTECPNCSGEVKKVGEEVAYKCLNKNCYAVNLRRLIHWASKSALDIEGLGKKIVEQLIKEGLVNDVADFYKLTVADLKPLERFADKSAENLIKSIQGKKEIELNRFIYGLGIHHVGEETAILLSKEINKEENPKISELGKIINKISLENLPDIGPIVAGSIKDWFNDIHNLELLDKLFKLNLKIKKSEIKEEKQILKGKIFVLTGTLSGLTRDEAKAKIRELGGEVSSSISKKTDFLLAGTEAGSKLKKAEKLGVRVIGESEFVDMIGK